MEFELSEEHETLQEVARDFLSERWSPDHVRDALDKQPALIDETVWGEIVEMGWLGAAAPEEAGGIGGDVMMAGVLAQEAGRGLLPGPFLTSLVSAIALDRSGDASLRTGLLADVIAGRTRVVPAVEEPGGDWGPRAVRTTAKADGGDGDGDWVLDGTKILVPDLVGADLMLVAASTPDGAAFIRVPVDAEGVEIEPMRRLDAQSISEVKFTGVRVPSDALLGGARAAATLTETYDIWTVLCAADLLGAAEASLDLSTKYANERVQFGRPIGSFQAVSHRLADVFIKVEAGRSLLYGACLALDEGRDDAPALVSAAKAWLSEAAVEASEAALKVHAGVGFTWEYDVHLYLRRSRSNAATLGDADWHRDRVAAYLDQHMGRPK